ncbi:hypothetical protein Leryth_026450, partial [Lithospermum erythrorhizon]
FVPPKDINPYFSDSVTASNALIRLANECLRSLKVFSGCVKSTLSAFLGSKLGITTVISTNSIRISDDELVHEEAHATGTKY